MPAVVMSSVVRAILTADINLSADEVIKRARLKGVTAPERSVRDTIYNVRSGLKKKGVRPAPAAARETKVAKPAAPVKPAPAAPVRSSSAPGLAGVLANVALVNAVVGASGGIEPVRQVAEAVRACGGVEAFLQHLDLVAKVRGGAPA